MSNATTIDSNGPIIIGYSRYEDRPLPPPPSWREAHPYALSAGGVALYIGMVLVSSYLFGKAVRRGYISKYDAMPMTLFWPLGWLYYWVNLLHAKGVDDAAPTLQIRDR